MSLSQKVHVFTIIPMAISVKAAQGYLDLCVSLPLIQEGHLSVSGERNVHNTG